MREIVPYIAELGDMNLKDTLMAGVMISNLTTFFKTAFCAHLSDLMENGKSQGAVIFVPGITAKALQNEFNMQPKDDFYADDDEREFDDDEDDDYPLKKIKRKVRR